MRGIFGPGTLVLGGGAFLLVGFLVVGFVLPGTWEATAEASIDVALEDLQPYLDSPEGWREWTPWPDSVQAGPGPTRGPGATMTWTDPELGSGSFRIDDVDAGAGSGSPRTIAYSVEVEGVGGSAMRTTGTLTLVDVGDATRLVWREEGDLGSNPLMGYWALAMERAQGTEMSKSLDRLAEVASRRSVTSEPAPTR